MEHLTEKQVEDYSLRQLPAADLLALSDHLAECENCRRRIEGVNGDGAFFALHEETLADGLAAGAHLSAEQTADFVDKNLTGDALQVVNDHLTTCERCVLGVTDLQAFRNEIAPTLDRHFGPTPVPTATTNGWRRKFVSLFKVAPVPAFGTAALAVLLLAAIAWLVWRTPREEKQEVVVAPTPVSQPTSVEPSAPPPTPVAVVAELRDGGAVLMLDQEGKLTGADALPPAYQNMVKKALDTQRIERSSQLQGLTRPPSALMGANDQAKEFSVLEPAGNVLLSNQPAFRWSALEGATAYVVEVYDDQFQLVASSPQLTGRSWTITQPLARGKIYSWQVKARKDGAEVTTPRPPASQAKFRVLDEEKTNELAKAKRSYGSSHLTLGLLYAEAGLLREAEQQFRLLRRANPDSELARKLHRQVQSISR